ncbi:ESX secretion-associated protein EspG [Amycolatopsis anabasis]|uniref:ESX secretion-associated protein EspG n=1 Tax=Amycolatopsis anabasis TaxID=1840409 RepID=UPI00131EB599|nr:ESX secretion-associated protein EspG [Amycolatopsis anabasis]
MDILDEDLGLGRLVYPYEIPYVSPTFTERAEQRARTWRRLREDGLADQNGAREDLAKLLKAWSAPRVLLTQVAEVLETDSRYLYRGGWLGDLGFLCSQRGERLVIDRMRPEHVVPEMVAVLPDWRARLGGPVTVLVPKETGPAEPTPWVDEPADDPRMQAMRPVEHFFAAPMLRYGVIECSVREPDTQVRRGKEVPVAALNWFDTTEGRFFVATEDLPDGARRHTFTPADRSRIAQWLRERLNRALGG